MDLDLGRWICIVLEWTMSKKLVDLSLLQRQSASQERHGSMGDSTFSSISLLGRTSGQEALYETCTACALSTVLCYISREPQRLRTTHHLMDTQAPRDRRLHEVRVCETCVLIVSFTLIYTHFQH